MTRVLLAVLDWGLGHATRCIPVIQELRRQGCEVLLAGSGDSLALLQKEFPTMRSFTLPGYHPRYPRGKFMAGAMALQLPRFMQVIAAEHRATDHIVAQEKIDVVISDNRYGCWSKKAYSIFMTHQSNILMPRRFGWMRHFVRILNQRLINRYHACWIPDHPGTNSLAGELVAHGMSGVKIKTAFIGRLSRFRPGSETAIQYDVVAIFSGPEPQRTILENIVVPQLQRSGLRYRVVRGLPALPTEPLDDRIVNFLPSDQLQRTIEAADVIIARSGYSTVMDMQALGKKVVFIPTPGQTEQEYLARRLRDKGVAFFMKQGEFDLTIALQETNAYSGFGVATRDDLLSKTVSSILT